MTLAVMTSYAAAADPPPLSPLHPFALGAGRPSGLELASPDDHWVCSVQIAYGNSFRADDGVVAAHALVDGAGGPLSDLAFDTAAAADADRTTWMVDAETVRLDLEVQRSWGSRAFIGGRLSTWRLGGTFLDALPERWHDLIGFGRDGRELFPNRATQIRVSRNGRSLETSTASCWQLGDATLWGGLRLPGRGRWHHRTWLAATLPGGADFGAAGPAAGLRWAGLLELDDATWFGGVGWTVLGRGSWPADRTRTTWHAWAGFDRALGRRWGAGVVARADDSQFRDRLDGRPAARSAQLALGPWFLLSDVTTLHLSLGEDFPGMGSSPDFSVHARVAISFD